jgi:hypothetical protein
VHDIMQKWSAKKYNVISEEIRWFWPVTGLVCVGNNDLLM